MVKPISNILVPVDFSENTDVAISKALELYKPNEKLPTIHLFHSQRIVFTQFSYLLTRALAGYTQQQLNADIAQSKARLEELRTRIGAISNCQVCCWVSYGKSVQDAIISKAKDVSADMVIIGKHSHHSIFPFLNTVTPSKIALRLRVPVLTAKPGAFQQEIRTVVVPVGNNFPEAKMEALSVLGIKSRPNIRLVLFQTNGLQNSQAKQILLVTFQKFKKKFSFPVCYDVLQGRNKVKSLLEYCKQVEADVLIVNPGAETSLRNWTATNISDHLPADSRTQILAITP